MVGAVKAQPFVETQRSLMFSTLYKKQRAPTTTRMGRELGKSNRGQDPKQEILQKMFPNADKWEGAQLINFL